MSSTFQFNRLRGCSVAFGYLAVRRFLDNNDLMCVIRAHAVQEDGYYRHFEKALKKRDVGEIMTPTMSNANQSGNSYNKYYNKYMLLLVIILYEDRTKFTTTPGSPLHAFMWRV